MNLDEVDGVHVGEQSARIGWLCGWGTTAQVWEPIITKWTDAEHIVFPIEKWFDQAQNVEDVMDRVYREINAFADQAHAKGQSWRLVGWSLGGMVALGAFLRSVQSDEVNSTGKWYRFRGLDLLSSTLCFVADPPRAGWSLRVLDLMKRGLLANPQEFTRVLQRFREQVGLSAAQLPVVECTADAWNQKALVLGLDALQTCDLRAEVERVAQFVLLDSSELNENERRFKKELLQRVRWIHGTADKTCPIAAMPMNTWIATSQIDGAGHAVFLERESEVYDWLRKIG